jgi:hypothetical protein
MAHPDFEELLASFNASGVRYLIGGAHALAHHARPRASKDLEVYIDATPANARRVVKALMAFFDGKPPKYVDVGSLLAPDTILQLGVAPVRVDLINRLATTSFSKAWKRRSQSTFGGVPCAFIGIEDLMAEKAHFARPQDLADLALLTRMNRRAATAPSKRRKGR